MPKQIIIIHGGNAFASQEEFLNFLKNQKVSREYFMSSKRWKNTLHQELGENFEVLAPRMPNEQNAKYAEWKIWFERMLPFVEERAILLGHSLGGIFLAKYLSENKFPKKINALFIIAAPYYEIADKGGFALGESLAGVAAQCNNIHLYQSQDDPEVPFSEVEKYQKELPGAKMHIFKDRGHFKQEHFPEIVAEIKKLALQ
jgi:predicted alpha/beta hydrolase family esterase